MLHFKYLTVEEKKAMVFAIIIALLSSLSSIALMATAGMFLTLMGIAGVSGTTVNLFIYSSSIRFFALSRTGLRYLERIISHQTTFKIIVKLRSFLFKKALNLELKEAQLLRNSEVTRLLTKNTKTIELSFIRQVQPIFVALITVLLVNAYMAYFDVKFALINLILCICSGVLVPYLIYKVLLKNLKAQDTLLQNLNNLAFDLVNGLFDLKLTHAFDKFKELFVSESHKLQSLHQRQLFTEGICLAFTVLCSNLAMIAVLYVGSSLVVNASLNGAVLIMLSLTTLSLYEVLLPLNTAFNYSPKVKLSKAKLQSFIDKNDEINLGINELIESLETIDFKDASFSYHADRVILDKLNLHFDKHHNYLLKGPSGIGKSTLFKLIEGLIDLDEGKLLYNQIESTAFNKHSIREHISYCMQDLSIFSGTIKDLFTMVKPNATDDEIFEVLKEVELDDLIKSLPNGLYEWIGSTGLQISGGQARRLTLARSLICDRDFLLVDEPTQGLDVVQENRILNKLLQKKKGIILVSHHHLIIQSQITLVELK